MGHMDAMKGCLRGREMRGAYRLARIPVTGTLPSRGVSAPHKGSGTETFVSPHV